MVVNQREAPAPGDGGHDDGRLELGEAGTDAHAAAGAER
jgi:hypothetical protein